MSTDKLIKHKTANWTDTMPRKGNALLRKQTNKRIRQAKMDEIKQGVEEFQEPCSPYHGDPAWLNCWSSDLQA